MDPIRIPFRFCLAEARNSLVALWAQVRWHHRFWFVVAMFTMLVTDVTNSWVLPVVLAVVLLGFMLWARLAPYSYFSCVSRPIARRTAWLDIKEQWPVLMQEYGMLLETRGRKGESVLQCPDIGPKYWRGAELTVHPQLLTGQTVSDFQSIADRMRSMARADSVRVTGDLHPEVTFTFGDPLEEVIYRNLPDPDDSWDAQTVWMGVDSRAEDWALKLAGTHTLIAGSSGAGKASFVWGVTIGLAPAIARGEVQIHGIDLKGGMELGMGKNLFTRYAVTPPEAVVVLEEAVEAMQQRATSLAGHTRQVRPSADSPLVVVLVDEVAALMSYVEDRTLKSRARTAISLLCSQGRAVGYTVIACLQDPRKETLPNRGLFTQMVGLRMKDREETAMVLGDGAVASGALCHKIPATSPGIGYVTAEDGGEPIRVRAAFVGDTLIREAAREFPCPNPVPVVVPDEPEKTRSNRGRSKTATEGER